VYPELERAEGALSLKMDAGDDRKPRTIEEMEKEALWLKGIFDAQSEQA
jgi:bis(5'-adenosyl)-triphosphatase